MADSQNIDNSKYGRVKIRETEISDYPVAIVETPPLEEGRVKREHRRIIGRGDPRVSGHPIIYSDLYLGSDPDAAFAYARHDVDKLTFVGLFEQFMDDTIYQNYREATQRPRAVIQTQDELVESEFGSYPEVLNVLRDKAVIFARLYFPFGDMTVEFADDDEKPRVFSDELSSIANYELPRRIESPLFAFDVSRSDVWSHFLIKIHWAREFIDGTVLQAIIVSATPAIAV